jgi:hypothetical protein
VTCLLLDRSGSKTDPIEMTVIDRRGPVRSIWHGRIHWEYYF